MMLSLLLKDKNSVRLLFTNYKNNKLVYSGVKLVNSNALNINQDIIIELYNLLKRKPSDQYVYSFEDYDVYYDNVNYIKHYIKNGNEDFLMFYRFNGFDVILYSGRKLDDQPPIKKFIINGIKIVVALSFIQTIFTSLPNLNTTDIIENDIKYTENIIYNDSFNASDAINLINSSVYLNEKEKQFLSNERLLNDVVYLYEGTEMSYIIKKRLTNIQIIYKKLPEKVLGEYCGDNIIYLDERFENVKYDDPELGEEKLKVLAHEFIHLLQSIDCPIYLAETTAELIAHEYFFNSTFCNHYIFATDNLKLLIETIGPKIIWDYTFSGDSNSFYEYLSNYLSVSDLDKLNDYLNKRASDSSQNQSNYEHHKEFATFIEELYEKINHEKIGINPNIFKQYNSNFFNSVYIHKNHYFYQYDNSKQIEDFTFYQAEKMFLIKSVTMYEYTKNFTPLEYEFFKNRIKISNSYSYDKVYKKYSYNKNNPIFHGNDKVIMNTYYSYMEDGIEYIYFYTVSKNRIKMSVSDAIDKKIINKVEYEYHYYTSVKDSIETKDMTYVDSFEDNIPSDDTVNIKDFYTVTKEVYSINDRFPNQIIINNNDRKEQIKK